MINTVEMIREFLKSVNSVGLAGILSGLGLTTAVLAFSKWSIDRYRWVKFKKNVHTWLNEIIEAQRNPKEFEDDEWKAACERLLTTAYFTPAEITQVLEVSVLVTKGLAADKFFI